MNQRERDYQTAKTVISIEETDGWKEFVRLATQLADTSIPNVSQFSPEGATLIASQVAFASGIKRCLGIMQQQKEIAASLKPAETI